MKTLIVYYSLTGKAKTIAEVIAKNLTADIEAIQDQKDRRGIWSKIVAGFESMQKKSTTIAAAKFNPNDYDLVIIGTPVWVSGMTPAVRAWLTQYANSLKRVAFFATMGGSGDIKTFKEMEALANKKPIATVAFTDRNIVKNNYQQQLDSFLAALK
ncbi:MAG: hypothetical protein M1561_02885 [Gammaproteobacteria bacterium]|nr:hypothetical protein [Gammaproteobacteria bacterium]